MTLYVHPPTNTRSNLTVFSLTFLTGPHRLSLTAGDSKPILVPIRLGGQSKAMLKILAESFRQNTFLGYLAIVRIFIGYHFISVAVRKLSGGFLSGDALPGTLAAAADDPFSWHRDFVFNVVVPNSVVFSYLVCFGELAIGISLLFGCLVRVSSLFGAFHNLNIYLAIAIPRGGATLGLNRLFIVCLVIFALAGAGRSLGLDGILKKRFPQSWQF